MTPPYIPFNNDYLSEIKTFFKIVLLEKLRQKSKVDKSFQNFVSKVLYMLLPIVNWPPNLNKVKHMVKYNCIKINKALNTRKNIL